MDNLPIFTKEGWFCLIGAGLVGGIIGASLFVLTITQFLKP